MNTEMLNEGIGALVKENAELRESLGDLLDGLDANTDPEICGLTQLQWDKIVSHANELLSRLQAEKGD